MHEKRGGTEQGRSEEALRESEEIYHTLVDMSPDAIIVSGEDSRIMNVSGSAVEMLGYESADELIGRDVFDLFPPEDRERAVENRRMRHEGKSLGLIEYTMLKKDGARLEVELSASVFHDSSGEPKGVIGIARDITERKEVEERVRQAEKKYRELSESLPEVVFETDQVGTLTYVNEKAISRFGYTKEEVEGRLTVFDMIAEEERGKARRNVELLYKTGKAIPKEYIGRRKDGSTFPIMIYSNLVVKDGRAGGIRGFVTDISEQKKRELELERINDELEMFANTISHDLRGPLAALLGANKTLQLLLKDPDVVDFRSDIQEMTEIIDTSIARAERLINDVLSLAETAQVPKEVTDVDVSEVLEKVVKEREADIRERGVVIETRGSLGRVVANSTHIYQVFANLIGNAIKHNDNDSPEILVERLGSGRRDIHRFLVRDNGSGIPEELIDHVFEPFHKGKSGTSGIGLAIVERVVGVYDGDVRAYNDSGACFEFEITDFVNR